MPDTSPEVPAPDAKPAKSKWKGGKIPHSSDDFNKALRSSSSVRVEGETRDGSHATLKCRLPDGSLQPITVIQGQRDLQDTNPKVWHKLVKTLKTWGVIALAAGSATLIASQLSNLVK